MLRVGGLHVEYRHMADVIHLPALFQPDPFPSKLGTAASHSTSFRLLQFKDLFPASKPRFPLCSYRVAFPYTKNVYPRPLAELFCPCQQSF